MLVIGTWSSIPALISQQATIVHLASALPTFLNGVQLTGRAPLKHGDLISIAHRQFRYETQPSLPGVKKRSAKDLTPVSCQIISGMS